MWAAAGAVALMLAACGGSGTSRNMTPGAATPQPTAGTNATAPPGPPTVTIKGTSLPPTPISDVQKTAVALGRNVPFSDYTDPNGKYVVGLPDGWTLSKSRTGIGATLAGAPATAQIGVYFIAGATVNELIQNDRALQAEVGEGDMPTTSDKHVTVAGVSAEEIIWQGFNNGLVHQHWFIYFESHGAAWRLVLTTFPSANVNDMMAIFQHMIDSFRFT